MKPTRLLSLLFILLLPLIATAQPDRSTPPKPGPPPSLKLPPIQRFSLRNGVPVVFMERKGVPIVELRILVTSGSASESEANAGITSMTTSMMMEGAGTRDALQLADAIDFLGAETSVSAGLHTTVASLHSPTSKFDDALMLLADIVLRPTFPKKELDRLRSERLNALIQRRDEPRVIASALFDQVLFGKAHPYGIQHAGSKASLGRISTDDLKKQHASMFHAGQATIIVVGDVTKSSVSASLEKAFGSWKKSAKLEPEIPQPKQVESRSIFLMHKPDAAQSVIRIGRIGAPRLTEDYYALIVMNTILGGSFSSRLNQNLRERNGFTYGAFSTFSMRPNPGPFTASADVQTDVTDKALTEFMNELRAIREDVPNEELTRAKNYVALGYPKDFQTIASIADALEELVQYNLPDSFFNTYIEKILAVSTSDVKRVAQKYIDPERIAIIVVGDRGKILDGMKALQLGPIHERSIEEILGE